MTILQACLIAFFCYIAAEGVPFAMGNFGGYYVLSKPLVGGLIVGLILGDMKTGIMVGAAVQAVFLGTMAVGGTIQTDITLIAYPAVALGVLANGDASVSIAIGTAIGAFGIIIFNGMELFNVFWGHSIEKRANQGDYKGVLLYQVVIAQFTTFLLRFVPTFLIVYFGSPFVDAFTSSAPEWILHGLEIIGGVLPAVGIAMITAMIIKKASYWAYFMIGFVCIVYFHLDLIAVAVIALIITIVLYNIQPAAPQNNASHNDMEVDL